jgi:hypothetical protein
MPRSACSGVTDWPFGVVGWASPYRGASGPPAEVAAIAKTATARGNLMCFSSIHLKYQLPDQAR